MNQLLVLHIALMWLALPGLAQQKSTCCDCFQSSVDYEQRCLNTNERSLFHPFKVRLDNTARRQILLNLPAMIAASGLELGYEIVFKGNWSFKGLAGVYASRDPYYYFDATKDPSVSTVNLDLQGFKLEGQLRDYLSTQSKMSGVYFGAHSNARGIRLQREVVGGTAAGTESSYEVEALAMGIGAFMGYQLITKMGLSLDLLVGNQLVFPLIGGEEDLNEVDLKTLNPYHRAAAFKMNFLLGYCF